MWVYRFIKEYLRINAREYSRKKEVITLPDILLNVITIEAVQKGGHVKYAKYG